MCALSSGCLPALLFFFIVSFLLFLYCLPLSKIEMQYNVALSLIRLEQIHLGIASEGDRKTWSEGVLRGRVTIGEKLPIVVSTGTRSDA